MDVDRAVAPRGYFVFRTHRESETPLHFWCPMRRKIIVSIGLLLVLGCGSKPGTGGSVTGTIHYKEKPVNGVLLHFYPASGNGVDISVPVSQEGTFRSSNIPLGEYKVVVEASQGPPPGAGTFQLPKDPAKAAEMKEKLQQMKGQTPPPTIPFPKKYQSIQSTDLKCTINQGEQKLPLELKD